MSVTCPTITVTAPSMQECYRGIIIYYPHSPNVPTITEWEGQVNYRDYYLAYVNTSLYQNPFKWVPDTSVDGMKKQIDTRMAVGEVVTQC